MSQKPFQFKQFTVDQDQCAMKVGTDGVLLGAWTPCEKAYTVLDVGSGTGLIALMIAQRSEAQEIDGLEIDSNAYEQCVENFENSPWDDRLFNYHTDFESFYEEMDTDAYDLIVSNPPFFEHGTASPSSIRQQARSNNALPTDILIKGVNKLLSPDGLFSVVLPFDTHESFVLNCKQYGLHLDRICYIKGHANSPVKRCLMLFSFVKKSVEEETLILEVERNVYTEPYKTLLKDFLLKL